MTLLLIFSGVGRYGAAVWTATDASLNVVAAGTLMVSDEQAERYDRFADLVTVLVEWG